MQQYHPISMDDEDHTRDAPVCDVRSHLEKPATQRSAEWHPERPTEFDSRNIPSNDAPARLVEFAKPVLDRLLSTRTLVERRRQFLEFQHMHLGWYTVLFIVQVVNRDIATRGERGPIHAMAVRSGFGQQMRVEPHVNVRVGSPSRHQPRRHLHLDLIHPKPPQLGVDLGQLILPHGLEPRQVALEPLHHDLVDRVHAASGAPVALLGH